MVKKIMLALVFCALWASCGSDKEADFIIMGHQPVYVSLEDARDIYVSEPRASENLGKIYTKDDFIFINESRKGLHVVDNTDPRSPNKIAFINIPGNTDIAIKGNTLYADNGYDLISMRLIEDMLGELDIELVNRIENAFDPIQKTYPQSLDGYFECVNPELGIVVGWDEVELTNPRCKRD